MPTTNARFEKITGEAEFEVIGIEIQGNFDPVTDTGTVTTNAAKFFKVDGEYRTDIPPARCGSVEDDLAVEFATILGTPGMTDPVTGADLSQVSWSGVLALMKARFDTKWNAPPEDPQEPEEPGEPEEPEEPEEEE